MGNLFGYLIVILMGVCLVFFFFSLLFYDALIPKTNFKVFKEKIFLKLAIVCFFFYLVWDVKIKLTHFLCFLSSLLILQIFYSLYNRKKFQAWRKFDYCCVLFVIGVSLFDAIIYFRFFDSSFALGLTVFLGALYLISIFSLFFAIKFFKRFSFYLKRKKLSQALKEYELNQQTLKKDRRGLIKPRTKRLEQSMRKNLKNKN